MTITRQQVDAWDDEVDDAYKRGLHDGMKQERALWELSRLGQEIEAQPEQGPAAWLTEERYAQLHTAQRPWVGLTQKERNDVWYSVRFTGPDELAKAIEDKLKEKNT